MHETIINHQEACKILGIKPRTLRKWVQHKKVPFIKYSQRNIKFKLADLLAWQEKKTFEPVEIQTTKTIRQQRKTEQLKKAELDHQIDVMLARHYGNNIPKTKTKRS
jgi:excisionase family DNA binding protein